jgi:hypothetical protein
VKNWLTFALIVAALAFVLDFQVVGRVQAVEPTREAVPRERPVAKEHSAASAKAPEPQQKFGEYPCSRDCSEHKAGYRWADMNNITDPDDCTGKSGAFIEGCRVYARQHKRRTADD